MKPWREEVADESESEASNLMARVGTPPAWTAAGRKTVWERIEASAADSGDSLWLGIGWQLPLALAGSLALLVFAIVHAWHPSATLARGNDAVAVASHPDSAKATDWTTVDLGAIGRLRVRPGTVYRLPSAGSAEYRIALERGQLCAEIAHRDPAVQGSLVVETPQIKVFVVGTRFCIETHEGLSNVTVTEGRVRVQSVSGTAFVGAGEAVGSNDPRLNASPSPSPTPASPAPLARSALRPLTPPSLSPPTSLAEQNALFAQGSAARDRHDASGAIVAWRSYLQRFPSGVLAPEASAGVLAELVGQGRNDEALSAADDYLASFPADGRAAEVAFIRGNLLHDNLGRTADALAAYQRALALASRPGLRDDALFAVGACERTLGRTSEARETFERYQAEFPHGAHAGELSMWLAQ